tara:strand:- start:26586 stop:27011 length:426 start_codon:yes stop_codon:yes gene_type:complete
MSKNILLTKKLPKIPLDKKMKMVLDDASGLNLISACKQDGVIVRGQLLESSLVVYPKEIDQNIELNPDGTLNSRIFRAIAAKKPEVLLIGTGKNQIFPDPHVFVPLMDANVGYEIMDNASACRTFNILIGEGRIAALLLIQ